MTKLSVVSIVSCMMAFLFNSLSAMSQELTTEESKLYDLMMQYRKEHGLANIPISKSLNFVAKAHVKDLQENYVQNEKCNLHSWSDKGTWTPVCYTNDHSQAKLMWSKPKELTSYKGSGYEISFAAAVDVDALAKEIFTTWKSSEGHKSLIINKGNWKTDWKAIGIGIFGSYAAVWFGKEVDN